MDALGEGSYFLSLFEDGAEVDGSADWVVVSATGVDTGSLAGADGAEPITSSGIILSF
jgi:hypothetical protein